MCIETFVFKLLYAIGSTALVCVDRISIKVMGWNQYALNEPLLLGLHQMEIRLLARLGYDVFAVSLDYVT